MHDGDGERTHDHGQEEARHGERHSDGDRVGDRFVRRRAVTDLQHHDDRGRGGRERGIGGHGGADVSPAERHHLQCAAEHDALGEVPAYQSDERTGHQRLVELELIENALHAGEEGNDDDENNRDCRHVTSFLRLRLLG